MTTDRATGDGRPALVLVGPPGAEVSAVAVVLGARLGAAVLDTDAMVAAAAGGELSELFVDEGEQAFRARERAAVAVALEVPGTVVALGGGAVEDAGTRSALLALRDAGVPVVRLDVTLAHAVPRMGFNQPRPAGINPRQLWSDLMAARRPWYEQVASHAVDTDARTVDQVADAVLAALAGEEPA